MQIEIPVGGVHADHLRYRTTGSTGHFAPLPPLLRDILASGGLLARLADQGYLPAHLAPALRAPGTRAAGSSSRAAGSGD
ncbi:hypothetical protein [Nocardia sp. alder85J]|uniref:hypothetical protein n=1 Tax=Nocardia sp. alder85J TaxID=2862949 RepID=UPI001CD571AF|nr:hypothetical protein [Nocardia sp. alder85J]MCX4094364.1 hypothetical protein [Nocardia sp. alder85J]